MFSRVKWFIVIQLLMNEQALCRVQPLAPRNFPLPGNDIHDVGEKTDHQALHGSRLHLSLYSVEKPGHRSVASQKEERVHSAKHILSILKAKLQAEIKEHLYIQGNISCGELLSASAVDDLLSSTLPQELLGLSLVPVLVVAGCQQEAQTLVLKLYDLMGVADTEELLMEVEGLIQRRMKSIPAASTSERDEERHHIEAVMFNIQQLAGEGMGQGTSRKEEHCEGWTRVNGTTLIGTVVGGATGELEEAVKACERLGVLCAGVTSSGPGRCQAVLKEGSRILPSDNLESECWIHQCDAEGDVSMTAGGRVRRSPDISCDNKSEQRVYNVVGWIPAVSTLYNLGTAVYYASVNCSETAKERAILSAVDLGTDALMVATGGTAGVAGYALGAGVKTGVKAGVKYLLNSMRQEDDVLVNQISWEEGVLTIQ